MKNQASFSLKDKSKKSKCCLLQFLFGTLRVSMSAFCPNSNGYYIFLINLPASVIHRKICLISLFD